eukprot:scaffold499578_cov18-Prasinocladus_malaysianus.AAC.1
MRKTSEHSKIVANFTMSKSSGSSEGRLALTSHRLSNFCYVNSQHGCMGSVSAHQGLGSQCALQCRVIFISTGVSAAKDINTEFNDNCITIH